MQTASSTSTPDTRNDVRTISPDALLRLVSSGERVLVIDVRESMEIERSRRHFPNALRIPLHQLFVRRAELTSAKRTTVVTISNRGVRSRAAAVALSMVGGVRVCSLEGGLDAWTKKGFPLS